MTYRMELSKTTKGKINWKRIQDSTVGLTHRGEDFSDASSERVQRVFAMMKSEFDRALVDLKNMIRNYIMVTGGMITMAIALLIWTAVVQNVMAGAVVGGGSITCLTGIFYKIYTLGRDQAMLQTVPARYQLVLELAPDNKTLGQLLVRFLDETSSVRS